MVRRDPRRDRAGGADRFEGRNDRQGKKGRGAEGRLEFGLEPDVEYGIGSSTSCK
jgi:hypothetical protein